MSMRSIFVAIAAIGVAAPVTVRAQQPTADFGRARTEFVAGQARQASQTLLISSLVVRQEVGRSRDETVGMQLLDAEGRLEKLAAGIRAGSVTSVKTLEQSLTQIDRLLAQHHLQLASAGIKNPRLEDFGVLANDVDRAAFHYERSVTLDGHALAAEQATAVADARALAKEIGVARSIPKTAATVVSALERHVLGTAVVVTAQR